MSALVQDVCVAETQVDGKVRSTAGYRQFIAFASSRLVFILPGVVGPNLPADFATLAAYGDFATGVLAILALLAARMRPLFWPLVAAFNLVGVADLFMDYYHAIHVNLPAQAGQLGSAYVIPIIYVPILMITHVVSLYWLLRPQEKTLQIPRINAAQL
jgi:hypothetical protein